jgi:hypothetical protein
MLNQAVFQFTLMAQPSLHPVIRLIGMLMIWDVKVLKVDVVL